MHDKVVELIRTRVKKLRPNWTIRADVPGSLDRPPGLPKNERLLLAAFVPTSAFFAKMTALDAASVWWSNPDLVIEDAENRRYVVDVCDDTLPRIARKFENIVAGATEYRVAGCSFVHLPHGGRRFHRSETELLEKTAFKLLGVPHIHYENSTWLSFFKPMMDGVIGRSEYGTVAWECFDEWEWADDVVGKLIDHTELCFSSSVRTDFVRR